MAQMEEKDTYHTIKNISEGFYKEKGSKFFAFAKPVSDEAEVKEFLAVLKKKYYDARHYCYAWVMGPGSERYRAFDDGEPGHSAGDPILGQIRSRKLTDTLVVVVRYFGGTKLGIPGLIHAYKPAAADALANNEIIEKEITVRLYVSCDYPFMNAVMRLVKEMNIHISRQELTENCHLILQVRLGKSGEVKSRLSRLKGVVLEEK
jgi:uncharacterized YigZ family protein